MAEESFSTCSFRASEDFIQQLDEYVEKSEDYSSKSELIRSMLQNEFNRDARPLDKTWLEEQFSELNKVARQAAEEDFDLAEKPLPSDFQQEIDDLKDQLSDLNDDENDLDSERDKLEEAIVSGEKNTSDLDQLEEKESNLSAKKQSLESRLQTLKSLKSRAQERMAKIQEREDKIFDEKLKDLRVPVANRIGVALEDFLAGCRRLKEIYRQFRTTSPRIHNLAIREKIRQQQDIFEELEVHPMTRSAIEADLEDASGAELFKLVGDEEDNEEAEEVEEEEYDMEEAGDMDEEEAMVLEEEEIEEVEEEI